jgi:uncharacterized membrane protein
MLDIILATKFVHVLAAAIMCGTWLTIAVLMLLANGSGNALIVTLTAQHVVRVEKTIMIAAMMLQPVSGFPLAYVIGLSPLDEFWIVFSLAVYTVVVASWLAAVGLETRIRNVTRKAALDGTPLPAAYRPLFRVWVALAVLIVAGTIALFLLMVWQPRLD